MSESVGSSSEVRAYLSHNLPLSMRPDGIPALVWAQSPDRIKLLGDFLMKQREQAIENEIIKDRARRELFDLWATDREAYFDQYLAMPTTSQASEGHQDTRKEYDRWEAIWYRTILQGALTDTTSRGLPNWESLLELRQNDPQSFTSYEQAMTPTERTAFQFWADFRAEFGSDADLSQTEQTQKHDSQSAIQDPELIAKEVEKSMVLYKQYSSFLKLYELKFAFPREYRERYDAMPGHEQQIYDDWEEQHYLRSVKLAEEFTMSRGLPDWGTIYTKYRNGSREDYDQLTPAERKVFERWLRQIEYDEILERFNSLDDNPRLLKRFEQIAHLLELYGPKALRVEAEIRGLGTSDERVFRLWLAAKQNKSAQAKKGVTDD